MVVGEPIVVFLFFFKKEHSFTSESPQVQNRQDNHDQQHDQWDHKKEEKNKSNTKEKSKTTHA